MKLVSAKLSQRRLLCLDVSLCNTGVAVWEITSRSFQWFGCLSTSKEAEQRDIYVAEDNVRRCQFLTRQLGTIIKRWEPVAILAELPFGGAQNAKAAAAMAMSLAITACLAQNFGIMLCPVRPTETKQLVSGGRKASKQEVISFVQKRLGVKFEELGILKGKWEHVADAAVLVEVAKRNGLFGREILYANKPRYS